MKRQFLKSKYNELALKHLGIVKVKPEAINILQRQLNDVSDISGAKYYIITLAAFFFIGTAPFLFSIYFEYCYGLGSKLFLLLSKKEYLATHQAINISLSMLGIAIPLYTLIIPFHNIFKMIVIYGFHISIFKKGSRPDNLIRGYIRRRKIDSFMKRHAFRMRHKLVHDKKFKTPFFYIYISVLNYSAFLILFLYLISFNVLSEDTLRILLVIWLMLLSPIVAIAPTILFIIIALMFIDLLAPHLTIVHDIKNLPSRIVFRLLVLLETIDKLNEFDLVSSQRRSVASKILSISYMISNMGCSYTSDSFSDEQVKEKFSNAANAFKSLILFATFPKPGSIAQLRRYTIRMINIFLTGNLGNLPQFPYVQRVDSPANSKIGIIKKTLSIFGLLIYLVAPVALWIFATNHFDWKLDDVSKTLLTVLYSLWAVTGIFSFSSALATEVKELLISIIKQKFKATD